MGKGLVNNFPNTLFPQIPSLTIITKPICLNSVYLSNKQLSVILSLSKSKQTYRLGSHGNKLFIQKMVTSMLITPLVNKLDLLIHESRFKASRVEHLGSNLTAIKLCFYKFNTRIVTIRWLKSARTRRQGYYGYRNSGYLKANVVIRGQLSRKYFWIGW